MKPTRVQLVLEAYASIILMTLALILNAVDGANQILTHQPSDPGLIVAFYMLAGSGALVAAHMLWHSFTR